ncbi:putative reverse transcriptase domain-containing protein [Tanacetum coccineum]|uniref:Reverse transcriptase domain-containing protein n=1 Tax=Tanacetum coccineum TaxID=301880 RepID=A0ABQ4WH25_9ASTR
MVICANLHHHGPCPQKCRRCQRFGHLEKDCRTRLQGAGNDSLQNVICFLGVEKGHFKDKCPNAWNQQNEELRGRAYVVVENPQQNPNVVTGNFFLMITTLVFSLIRVLRRVLNGLVGISLELFIECFVMRRLSVFPLPNSKILEVQRRRGPEKELVSLALYHRLKRKKIDDILFQILKEKLCNAPVLALPDGPRDFVSSYDASKQGYRVRADAAARRTLSLWTKSFIYTDHQSLQYIFDQKDLNMRQKAVIRATQILLVRSNTTTFKGDLVAASLEQKKRTSSQRKLILLDIQYTRVRIRLYYDLRDCIEWPLVMKRRRLAEYRLHDVLRALRLKPNIKKPSGFLQQPEIPEWK